MYRSRCCGERRVNDGPMLLVSVRRLLGVRSAGRCREDVGENVERAGHQGVVRPRAPLRAGQEPGVDEHLEVVRHGRLGQVERFVQVAHAGFAALVGGDHREQAKSGRLADRLEAHRQELGVLGLQSALDDGRAACSRRVVEDGQ